MPEVTVRIIGTGMTELKYKNIIDAVFGQLSDGMWENSRRMEQYWRFIHTDIDLATNEIQLIVNTVLTKKVNVNTLVDNGFADMNDAAVKFWIANKLKQIVKAEHPEPVLWNRNNTTTECDYLSNGKYLVTIADAYWVYDRLKERKIS